MPPPVRRSFSEGGCSRALLFFLVILAPGVARAAGPVIREIRFVYRDAATGAEQRVDAPGPDWFAGKHELKVGEPYSQATADEDLTRFITTHHRLCVEVRAEPVAPGAVRVVYVFERADRVWAVRIVPRKGTPSVDATDLIEKAVHLRRDRPVGAEPINADRWRIIAALRRDGYHFATVTHRTEPVPDRPGFRTVIFEVDRGPKVQPRRILISGNRAVSTRTLRGLMRTKEDRWYTTRRFVREVYQEDLREIAGHYRSLGWEDVQVAARPVVFSPERVLVSVRHEPQPGGSVITDVTVQGAESVGRRAIRRRFAATPGGVFTRAAFERAVRWLEDQYYRAGFRADPRDRYIVHSPGSADEPGRSTVALLFGLAHETVTIDISVKRANGAAVVDGIVHKTTGPYTDAELAALDSLRPGAPFSEDALLRHVSAIGNFYTQPGPRHNHALVEVDSRQTPTGYAVRMEFQKKGPGGASVPALLRIHIDEGELYIVESVAFLGVKPVFEAHLRDRLRMKKGAVYRIQDREADERTVYMVFAEKGYPEATVRFQRTARPGQKVFDLVYTVEPGPLCYFDRVRPLGNDITRFDVVIREMPFKAGDRFDIRKILKGAQRLKRRAYFDQVEWRAVDSRRTEPGKKFKNIELAVREATPFPIYLGVGASSAGGVFGDLRYQDNNFDLADRPRGWNDFISGTAFRGGGQEFALFLQPGSETSRVFVRWHEPWFRKRPVDVDVSGGYFSREWDHYTVDRLGGEISVGKRFPGTDTTAFGGIRIHRASVTSVSTTAATEIWDDEGVHTVLGIFVGVRQNTLDDPLFPTDGRKAEVRAELVGTPFPRAIKVTGQGRMYRTVRQGPDQSKHVAAVWGDFGVIAGGDLPVFERLYAGGLGSVRGFATRGIGPRGRTIYVTPPGGPTAPAPGDGDAIGGMLRFAGGVEYHVPILKDQARGLVFLDVGSVAENTFDVGQLISDVRIAAGVGVHFRLPFLGRAPVAVYVGVPIKKVSGDETEALSFSIGLILR